MSYEETAKETRRQVLSMIHRAGTSHAASCLSAVDFAVVLYENLQEEDEVVWSCSWKAALIYYMLAKQGKIPMEDLERFAKEDEEGNIPYLGLAETTVPGVWVNGGSVGHGLPVSVGMALGKKFKGEDGTIHCIISDGEMNEGSVWEAAMLANHHKLNNLVVWVDANKWQAMGRTKDVIDLEPIEDRWAGFGWEYFRGNGHDFEFLHKVSVESVLKGPTVIICDTIKGAGVSFMEDHLLFHYKHVTDDDFKKAMEELA